MTNAPTAPSPPPPVIPPGWALGAAVLGVSWAGPLVRFTGADALAIAAWRLVLSVGFVFLVLALRRKREPLRMSRQDRLLALASGLFLAGHFWSWIASVQSTTVARSVILVSLQPVLAALLAAFFLKEFPGRRGWWGMGVALLGAGILALGAGGGRASLRGDLLALLAALLVAAYYVIGRRLRRDMDLWSYVGVVYGVAAVALVAAALLTGVPLLGYEGRDWAVFAGLAAGPMMLGHTGVNYALRYLPAHTANLALLGEPVGATLLAWLLPGIREIPDLTTVAGGLLVLAGIGVATLRVRGLRGRGGRGDPVA